MNGLLTETGRAVAFLSRLPVPDRVFDGHSVSIAQSAGAYGIAGIVIALPASVLLLLLLWAGVAPLFASAVSLSVLLLVSGALHEDGLADCADGFGGGSNRERILQIMKDSAIGTYGGIAIVMSLLLRVSGIAMIAGDSTPLAAALAIAGVAAVSRSAMVWHWHVLPAARLDGVAHSAGQPDEGAVRFAMISGAVVTVLLTVPAAGLVGALLALLLTAAACFAFTRFTDARISGHTGDTIGATQQVCEVAALLGLALWL